MKRARKRKLYVFDFAVVLEGMAAFFYSSKFIVFQHDFVSPPPKLHREVEIHMNTKENANFAKDVERFFAGTFPRTWQPRFKKSFYGVTGAENHIADTKGEILLNLNSIQEKSCQKMFESFCKKVLYRKCWDYNSRPQIRHDRAVLLLDDCILDGLSVEDEYKLESHCFKVRGTPVEVNCENISKALSRLPKQRRDIILLAYFLDMKDGEIAERLNIPRSTIQYQRQSSLLQLQKMLGGDKHA